MSKRNSYSAKHLSVAAKHVCSSGLRYYGGWTATLPPQGWSAGTHVCPSTSSAQDRQPRIHYHLIHYSFFFFFLIYTKHTAELYTNKPRALLMQQALYNEPKRARLLWEDGLSVQTLGGFPLQKTKLSLYRSPWICTCPNHPSPVFNRQCTQVHLTDQ